MFSDVVLVMGMLLSLWSLYMCLLEIAALVMMLLCVLIALLAKLHISLGLLRPQPRDDGQQSCQDCAPTEPTAPGMKFVISTLLGVCI